MTLAIKYIWSQCCDSRHSVKGLATGDYFIRMYTDTVNILWILCQFTNKHLIHYWHPDAHVRMWTLCEISLMWVFWLFGLWISKLGKFLLKLRTDHSGKFAPREINPLYSTYKVTNFISYSLLYIHLTDINSLTHLTDICFYYRNHSSHIVELTD